MFIGWAKTDPNKHVNTSTKEKMILIARYKYAKKRPALMQALQFNVF
jgi:hypothetical protein